MDKNQINNAINFYNSKKLEWEKIKTTAKEKYLFLGIVHCDWWINRCNQRINELKKLTII